MPYKIKKIKNGWVRINKKTGKVKAHHKTKDKALAAINLMKLYEEFLGSIAKTFNVNLQIDKTNHAAIRQARKENDFISNNEIKSTIDRAMMKIVSRLLTDKIFIGDKIHIYDSKTDLNIVGQINKQQEKLEFVIMREKNFHQKSNTKFLYI